jgi:phage shock protein A
MLLSPAEDPERAGAGGHDVALLRRLRAAIDAVAVSRARLETQSDRLRASAPHFEAEARQALGADREDLARAALLRRRATLVELSRLEGHIEALRGDEARLGLAEQRLTTQIEAARARQEVISARYSAAEAQVRINEALAGVADGLADLRGDLAETEEQTEEMQARASAIEELMQAGLLASGGRLADALERDLFGEQEAALVEEDLRALKARRL